MRLTLALTALATAGLATLTVGPAPAFADQTVTVLQGGYRSGPYTGYITFTEEHTLDGQTVYGWGSRVLAPPNTSSYLQEYSSDDCDPANAIFTSGVIRSDVLGRLYGVGFGGVHPEDVKSVAVRAAESVGKDSDGDGLFGPTDVIGIPGAPALGMWNRAGCDRHPLLSYQ